MKKIFIDKSLTFFILLIVITSVFLYFSYDFSITTYNRIENKQNNKNIENFLYLLDNEYKNLSSIKEESKNNIKNECLRFFDDCSINFENKTEVFTYIENFTIINELNYLNIKNNFLFHIQTKTYQELTKEGKNSIKIFSLIVIIILTLTILISITFQKQLNKVNEELEEKVFDRTNQYNHTIKELEKVNLKLYDLAHTDYLTQIKNRRSFFLHTSALFKKVQKSKGILSIIMIDIDNFKSINDTYGHEIGDKILKVFANSIKEILYKDEIFGRLGGEEFAIALPHTNLEEAFKIAENIRKRIERIVINIPSSKLFITASFGVSDSINTHSIDEIIKNADLMLYDAKRKGKNRVRSRLP